MERHDKVVKKFLDSFLVNRPKYLSFRVELNFVWKFERKVINIVRNWEPRDILSVHFRKIADDTERDLKVSVRERNLKLTFFPFFIPNPNCNPKLKSINYNEVHVNAYIFPEWQLS
jgi:hypothetical protein